jgi:CheY-like chemotaxis protein
LDTINLVIADDDEDDCIFFSDAVAELNVSARIVCFSNGAELMEALAKETLDSCPDILVLDLNMPLKNGMECLAEIRSNKVFDRLPIIIFSTSSQEQAVNAAYEGGATFYLKKPESFDKLKEALVWIFNSTAHELPFRVSRESFFINV